MKTNQKNVADESQVLDAERKAKRGRDIELNDVRIILETKPGRRFVWRYLEECGVFRSSASQSGSWTYFNEGQRNVGLKLIADIQEAYPEALLTMMKESKEGEKNNV